MYEKNALNGAFFFYTKLILTDRLQIGNNADFSQIGGANMRIRFRKRRPGGGDSLQRSILAGISIQYAGMNGVRKL